MSTDPRFAEPTPFARLVYAQATSACGDACILVSMAGSIFFPSPTSAARGKVLLFLLITMTPFVIVAPVLGPALDRMKGGRRLLPDRVGRGSGGAVHRPGHVHQQARARGPARVPARVRRARAPEGERDRQERAGPGAGEGRRRARHGQLAPRAHQRDRRVRRGRARVRGLQALRRRLVAALRCGRVRRRDDPRDPDPADATARARRRAACSRLERDEMHTPSILLGSSAMAVLRAMRRLPGVLHRVLAQARSLRAWAWPAAPPTSGTSSVCSSRPRSAVPTREEVILASSLVLPAAFTLLGALVAGAVGFVLAAFTLGIGAAAGRLGFDSLLQRDGPDAVRGARVRQVRDALPTRVGDRRHHRDHPVRQADGPVPPRHRAGVRGRSPTSPPCAPPAAASCARSCCPSRSTAPSRARATRPSTA